MNINSDFIHIKRGSVHGWVCKKGSDAVAAALFEKEGCSPLNAAGRGTMMQFPLQSGRTGVLRICRRGGLAGHFLKEGFLFRNRPVTEFRIHRKVLAHNIPAPTLLGVCWERRGLFYYGALATELLPGCDLNAWLQNESENAQRSKEILMSCGARIRQMHDRGVYHADLQLKNIFVADTGIFLLDFDGARVVQGNVSPLSCARNLLRLQRSFEKLGYPPKLWQQLLDGYGNILLPLWLRAGYRVKAGFSDMMQGRRTMQV